MKAIVYRAYGEPDVLQCDEIAKPVPGDGEVLVRVRAASVNPVDWYFMRGKPYVLRFVTGLWKPKGRLGMDAAGDVEAVGKYVKQFKPGDEVFGACSGALAEYGCAAESKLAIKPPDVTFEQASCMAVAGLTALQGLRDKAHVQPGQHVLVNGAAGGVGTFAVQIAKVLGAEVTGVCSTRNIEMVKSLGADHVVDYTREDFTARPERFDAFLDMMSNHPLSALRRILTPQGTYVQVGGPAGTWISPLNKVLTLLLSSPFVSQRLVTFTARINAIDLTLLGAMTQAGQLGPVIDKCYPLTEAAAAFVHLGTHHARGKIVINVGD